MIVELALGTAAAATVLVVTRKVFGRKARRNGTPPATEPTASGRRGRLRVGDVIIHSEGELWMAGHFSLEEEDGVVHRLFRTPAGSGGEWLLELESEARWLLLDETSDLAPEGRLPDEIRHRGLRLAVRRRAQITIRRRGEMLPPSTERAELVLFRGPGGRGALVLDFESGDRLALAGTTLDAETADVLPGR